MNQITITLTPEEMARLEEMAGKAGLTPEAYSRQVLMRMLDSVKSVDDESFIAAKWHVFEKYDDLLHRLAK